MITLPVTCYQLKWILYISLWTVTVWSWSVIYVYMPLPISETTPIIVLQIILTVFASIGVFIGSVFAAFEIINNINFPIRCRCKK